MSSQVVSGQVGLKATMPALRAIGHETVTLPTTLLSAHPAAFPENGAPAGGPIEPMQMVEIADWLLTAGALDNCAAILTGYLPSAAHIDAAAQIIAKIKAVNPQVFYCCDPICGDEGRLYLPEEVMHGLGDRLCLWPIWQPPIYMNCKGWPDATALPMRSKRSMRRAIWASRIWSSHPPLPLPAHCRFGGDRR